jgi:pimeloyl-ACP methyl ester carboxylesterase
VKAAVGQPIRDERMRLRDGRALAFTEWGDLDGPPIFFFHGSPLSWLWCPDEDATQAARVHNTVIPARPSYPARVAKRFVDRWLAGIAVDAAELPFEALEDGLK